MLFRAALFLLVTSRARICAARWHQGLSLRAPVGAPNARVKQQRLDASLGATNTARGSDSVIVWLFACMACVVAANVRAEFNTIVHYTLKHTCAGYTITTIIMRYCHYRALIVIDVIAL